MQIGLSKDIINIPKVMEIKLEYKYNKSKITCFVKLIQKMDGKFNGWGGKYLSSLGRCVMAKTVLESLHVYCMINFILPKEITKRSIGLIRKFWWGETGVSKGVYMRSWVRLSKRK